MPRCRDAFAIWGGSRICIELRTANDPGDDGRFPGTAADPDQSYLTHEQRNAMTASAAAKCRSFFAKAHGNPLQLAWIQRVTEAVADQVE